MRICIAYDCLFPWTVGGAERWYRNLAQRLAADGHEVTYITLRQWDAGDEPTIPGVTVLAVGPRMALYAGPGRRRILPPVVYGAGVLAHLARRGRSYDVVHLASFPYFSLLAAAATRPFSRFKIVVDWHEAWSRAYWREYLGRVGGAIGWSVQALCARVPQRAFAFSQLHARRVQALGLRDTVTVLTGEFTGSLDRPTPAPAQPLVVFAGRHIPEKRAPTVPPAVAFARKRIPELRGIVFGDGPEHDRVVAAIADAGVNDTVTAPGFVDHDELAKTICGALCLLLPSSREGYGMVVVEAAASGVPSIVVAGEDNAAIELIDEGENGFVAPSASPQDLAAAIVAVHEGGAALRERTADWYGRNARRLSLENSLAAVIEAYAGMSARR